MENIEIVCSFICLALPRRLAYNIDGEGGRGHQEVANACLPCTNSPWMIQAICAIQACTIKKIGVERKDQQFIFADEKVFQVAKVVFQVETEPLLSNKKLEHFSRSFCKFSW